MINESNKRFQELLGLKNKNGKNSMLSENFMNDDNSGNEDVEIKDTVEYFPITTPVGSTDSKTLTDVVNMGIDSSLEGFTKSNFGRKNTSVGTRDVFNFHRSELPVLMRRLEELYENGDDNAMDLLDGIKESLRQESGERAEEMTDETQYAPGKPEMPGIDEAYFMNENDLVAGDEDEESVANPSEYFIKTFYNGQFAQLRNLAKEMKEGGKMMDLYGELKDAGEEKVIDWLFKWLING